MPSWRRTYSLGHERLKETNDSSVVNNVRGGHWQVMPPRTARRQE
ncbi:hypothetical protein SLI_0524 [Streptomyces lividans 1326]|uniref:Uncharacterized protein n=1 Tax=Streptomyces lividans 1326 TaxID=1200984 RepID=A0A7U9H932_STRLI|nr:hypothetical protein SLI_0524 [Streptomyces lividans 1326]